jgi:uncharacterized membrane protein YphA (DoxX/SURF4 family)
MPDASAVRNGAGILRAGVGLVFMWFGAQMLFGGRVVGGAGLHETGRRLKSAFGLAPPELWGVVFGGLVFVAGFLLLIGLFTRYACIPVTVLSGLALFWPAWAVVLYDDSKFPFPLSFLLFSTSVAIYFLGHGGFSVDRKIAQERQG